MGIELAALAVSVGSTVMQYQQEKEAAKMARKQRSAETAMQMEQNRREMRRARNYSRIQQAAIAQGAANVGAGQSSGDVGARFASGTNMATNVGAQQMAASGAQALTNWGNRAARAQEGAALYGTVGKLAESTFLSGRGREKAMEDLYGIFGRA